MIWILLLVFISVEFSTSKVVPVFYDGLEDCSEPGERAGKFNLSEIKIVETDDEFFVNGTIYFLKEVKSPWKSLVYAEKFDRGQWNADSFTKQYPDFCKNIKNPLEPFNYLTKNLDHRSCPIPAGVSRTQGKVKLKIFNFINSPKQSSTCRD